MTRAVTVPPEREGHPAPADIAGRRAAMAQALAGGTWATDPPPEEATCGGVRVLRWLPDCPVRGRVIHFHGGGYRMGCPEMEGSYALALARSCGVEVIAPQYRLAPEAPFPAAPNDALAVFRSLPRDLPLILSGGSAGGGVAAALAVLACAQGAAPDGVVLHSPWLDQTVSAPSFDVNAASDPLFSREAAELAARLYLQGHDPRDPVASPLLANLADWPPTLVSVGTGEVLRDDAERFSKALAGAGGDCRLMVIAGMDHVAVTRDMAATGAAETFAATVEFIEALLPSRAFQTARGSSRHPGSSPG